MEQQQQAWKSKNKIDELNDNEGGKFKRGGEKQQMTQPNN